MIGTVLFLTLQAAPQASSVDNLRKCSTATHAAMAVSMMINDQSQSAFWNTVGGEIDKSIVRMSPEARDNAAITAQLLIQGTDDGYVRARNAVRLPSNQMGAAVHAIFTEARACAAELTPDLAASEPVP